MSSENCERWERLLDLEEGALTGLTVGVLDDLLEAAEQAERLGHGSYTPDDWNSAMRSLRAAIANARGERGES